MQQLPFDTVLIANRGEIAARIVKTLRKLGLRSAIAYHEIDARTPAVSMADLAIQISGSTPIASYLDTGQIIAAAEQARAGALHPGYGLLSENAEFARAVTNAGVAFIGPLPDTIELMGDKIRARNFVHSNGFPVAPCVIEEDDPATFASRAQAMGAPLLVKPSAGGGGKGMRIVRDLNTLEAAIEQARSEAGRYFGDARLYAERYLECPRHIEVQVLGDCLGNLVHLFERECSVQRRFQKIIEEAPSPGLSQELRARICDTAVRIARAANYRNAGTVEFIFSGDDFYFLEMNTRLQVEHPVTEMITGLDLVAEQIYAAAGRELAFSQSDVVSNGHAIELRLYAEAPERGYVPTTGKVLLLEYPNDVRIDSGIMQGQHITPAFDPMLAKIIVHSPSRMESALKAHRAVRELVLLGCETNANLLARIVSDEAFLGGHFHVGYLEQNPHLAAGNFAAGMSAFLASAALLTRPVRDSADAVPELHSALGNWRN
ncbi:MULTISPECIES: acetyl-CoA carboxylase biotin carboxylase subunit [unclassified Bradyrhizobium]|uniref:acetyl-CoA carboxylase biotin carboxylase subunit n=1 Tax=Bradyrhizobium sp. USDA 4541 TaxID=2817704 RepID=UPI0020A314E9|nr:biotin carboxylase N-terminal domain-containing protein [Bradyrhizobium sp. USDA 4541]MCP1854360.1 propionyl-CoA carboxylase alpha chain/3-methylcrotonyl-CoA carboxylase alpha subunit/acetyl-CoA/propionyl-CoA carboxylase biotin carboxyl carrier protein [Bradyrhizobium sp. USDA 4541]